MKSETYIAFIFASTLLIVAPGPSILVVVSHALKVGFSRSLFTLAGVVLSHTLFFCITALGLATVLLTSASLFACIKWVGAAYLVWMGVRQWQSTGSLLPTEVPVRPYSSAALFAQGFVVNMTNPKALIFYAAFFPPFLNPDHAVGPQLVVLGTTFIAILVMVSVAYAAAAARTRTWFADRGRMRLQRRVTGTMLIAAGVGLAATRND